MLHLEIISLANQMESIHCNCNLPATRNSVWHWLISRTLLSGHHTFQHCSNTFKLNKHTKCLRSTWIPAFRCVQQPVYCYSIIVSFAFSAIASFPQLLKGDTVVTTCECLLLFILVDLVFTIQVLHGSRSFEVNCHEETVLCAHKDFVEAELTLRWWVFPPCCLNLMGFVTDLWSGLSWMTCLVGLLLCLWVRIILIWLLKSFVMLLSLHCTIRNPFKWINVPFSWGGCGSHFSLGHALVCRKSGLIIQCHNGDLAALVWGHVVSEPVVRGTSVDDEAFCSNMMFYFGANLITHT